jgi:mono/diheme cytochrome c family protein
MLAWLGVDGGVGTAASAARPSAEEALVYASLVEPVLKARCVQCHGAAKTEGDLRLDTPDSLRKGGKSGPVFVAGLGAKSEIVRRIWLPASDADVMPPRGQRSLTPAEASLIRWWIDRGAKFDQKVMDERAAISPDVRPAIEAVVGPIPFDFGGPTLPKVKVAPAGEAALTKVRATGVSIVPLSANTPFVHVHCTNVRATFDDKQLAALEVIAPQVLWLDLSGTQITDAGLAVVARFPNLTRLHLNRTSITDAGITHVARLSHLEYLNLYATKITDAGLVPLAGIGSLRALYVWQTGVTPQGIERLKASLPKLVVD